MIVISTIPCALDSAISSDIIDAVGMENPLSRTTWVSFKQALRSVKEASPVFALQGAVESLLVVLEQCKVSYQGSVCRLY
jgi:hypothetical protein